jgi:hypothetical protein
MAHSLTLVHARPRPTPAAAAAFRTSTRGDSTSRYTPARGARTRTRVAAEGLRPSASATTAATPPPPPCRAIVLSSTPVLPLRSRGSIPSPSPRGHYNSRTSSPVSTAASGSPPPPQEEPYDWAQFFPLLREDASELLKLAVSLGAAGSVITQVSNFISDSQLHLVWWECCIISRLSRLVD